MNKKRIRLASALMRALNHELRYDMLNLIGSEGRLCVTEIYETLDIDQSVASQHLAILRRVGIVNTHRDGRKIYYSLNEERIQVVKHLLENVKDE